MAQYDNKAFVRNGSIDNLNSCFSILKSSFYFDSVIVTQNSIIGTHLNS